MWLHYTHCWRSSLSLVSIGHWPETIVLYPNASVSSCLTLWPLLHLPIAISLTCLSCSVLSLRLNAWPPLHTDLETVKINYWYWRCCNRSIRLVSSHACWASPHLLWCNLVLLYEGALNLVLVSLLYYISVPFGRVDSILNQITRFFHWALCTL